MSIIIVMGMKSNSKPKNLISGEEEKTPSTPEKNAQSVESFLDMTGMEWEKRGKATYIYPSSIAQVREILEKLPSPTENEYVIIPLGSTSGYSAFIMVTSRSTSIRIGYARNSIPYSTSLLNIVEKTAKVSKELGIENRKNSKNLIEV